MAAFADAAATFADLSDDCLGCIVAFLELADVGAFRRISCATRGVHSFLWNRRRTPFERLAAVSCAPAGLRRWVADGGADARLDNYGVPKLWLAEVREMLARAPANSLRDDAMPAGVFWDKFLAISECVRHNSAEGLAFLAARVSFTEKIWRDVVVYALQEKCPRALEYALGQLEEPVRVDRVLRRACCSSSAECYQLLAACRDRIERALELWNQAWRRADGAALEWLARVVPNVLRTTAPAPALPNVLRTTAPAPALPNKIVGGFGAIVVCAGVSDAMAPLAAGRRTRFYKRELALVTSAILHAIATCSKSDRSAGTIPAEIECWRRWILPTVAQFSPNLQKTIATEVLKKLCIHRARAPAILLWLDSLYADSRGELFPVLFCAITCAVREDDAESVAAFNWFVEKRLAGAPLEMLVDLRTLVYRCAGAARVSRAAALERFDQALGGELPLLADARGEHLICGHIYVVDDHIGGNRRSFSLHRCDYCVESQLDECDNGRDGRACLDTYAAAYARMRARARAQHPSAVAALAARERDLLLHGPPPLAAVLLAVPELRQAAAQPPELSEILLARFGRMDMNEPLPEKVYAVGQMLAVLADAFPEALMAALAAPMAAHQFMRWRRCYYSLSGDYSRVFELLFGVLLAAGGAFSTPAPWLLADLTDAAANTLYRAVRDSDIDDLQSLLSTTERRILAKNPIAPEVGYAVVSAALENIAESLQRGAVGRLNLCAIAGRLSPAALKAAVEQFADIALMVILDELSTTFDPWTTHTGGAPAIVAAFLQLWPKYAAKDDTRFVIRSAKTARALHECGVSLAAISQCGLAAALAYVHGVAPVSLQTVREIVSNLWRIHDTSLEPGITHSRTSEYTNLTQAVRIFDIPRAVIIDHLFGVETLSADAVMRAAAVELTVEGWDLRA